MNRREFSALGLMMALGAVTQARATDHAAHSAHEHALMTQYADLLNHPKVTVGLVVYPGMFLMDLVGPLSVFDSLMNKEIHLLWKDTRPFPAQRSANRVLMDVTPTTSFSDCPEQLDVLFVPGGVPGTFDLMQDQTVLQFLKRQAPNSRYVSSVCTGSLVLGAAGLLKGYRAASHWATLDVLKDLGATPDKARIVVDRNRVTGGGVTAGLDFGLKLAALLVGDVYAQAIQLYLEYNPQPPFNAGSPETAHPAAKAMLDAMFVDMVNTARSLAKAASI